MVHERLNIGLNPLILGLSRAGIGTHTIPKAPHSGAIRVQQTGQMIGMTLDDDGIGFDDAAATAAL